MSEEWPGEMRGPMDVLSKYKEQGKMRAVGVSNHDFGAFCTAAECDWVDVVLAMINYAGHAMDNTPDKVAPVIEKIAQVGQGCLRYEGVGWGGRVAGYHWTPAGPFATAWGLYGGPCHSL